MVNSVRYNKHVNVLGRRKIVKLIERKRYLEILEGAKNTPDIKVITGARRVGKSKLLTKFIECLKLHDSNINVVHINLLETENEKFLDYHQLHDYVLSCYDKSKVNYLFIDEIQFCYDFEKVINSLHTKELFDIYITGSNAFLLSSDLANLFIGRTLTIEVYPFSFQELL